MKMQAMMNCGRVLALHDGHVGVLDHARLPGRLEDVFQLNLHIVHAPSALQHL